MNSLDEQFEYFLTKHIKDESCIRINEEVINSYEKKLPKQLFKYWKVSGWCSYGNGLIWMVNPSEYEDIMLGWLEGTIFEDRDDLSVIARTAFGEFYIWAKSKGSVFKTNPNLNTLTYFPEEDENKFNEQEEEEDMRSFWGFKRKSALDYKGDDNNPLFDKALKKFGILNADEMYGFKHHHHLGGVQEFDNLNIVKLDVYYDIAKQIKDIEVVVIK